MINRLHTGLHHPPNNVGVALKQIRLHQSTEETLCLPEIFTEFVLLLHRSYNYTCLIPRMCCQNTFRLVPLLSLYVVAYFIVRNSLETVRQFSRQLLGKLKGVGYNDYLS